MKKAAREIITPRPKMSLTIPQGMAPVEFFNSPANLKNLAEENGLFRTPENLLMYRKLIGHMYRIFLVSINPTLGKHNLLK